MTESPHRNLRVLELAQGVAGSVCGRLLAGLGHDVVKCEPPGGDFTRGFAEPDELGSGPLFAELNAAKRAIVYDPELERELFAAIARADIVIVDGTPHSAALAAPTLRDRFPRLVVVAVTSFGLDCGPDTGEGDSLLAEAAGGLAHMIGEPDRSPLALGGEQAGYATGFVAFFAAMLALRRRDRLGAGELIDVAVVDVVAYNDWKSDLRYHETGRAPARSGAAAGRWRMLRASDGWVGVIFEPTQWNSLVALIDDPRLADPALADDSVRSRSPEQWWPAVEEWAVRRTKLEIYELAQARGLPFGHAVTVPEVLSIPQYRERGFLGRAIGDGSVLGAPFGPGSLAWVSTRAPGLGQHQHELAALWPARPAVAVEPAAGGADHAPLDGVTVLDLGTITAGAAVGRLLADYGATVIKVESPDRPDAFRKWIVETAAPTADGNAVAPMFDSNNAGKLGLALDLKTPDGVAAFRRLVERADVLVENFGIGVTERLGIDFATLHAVNRRLVYVSLSSQGQHGPERYSRSYGSTLDLLSGLASVTGYDADALIWSSVAVNYPDQLAGVVGAAVTAYCAALDIRGVHIDLSQREVTTWTIGAAVRRAAESGRTPTPTGNGRPGRVPHEVYPCAGEDSWVAIGCRTDHQREALSRLLCEPTARATEAWWRSHAAAMDAAIAGWTAVRSVNACLSELLAAGVPCAPVVDAEQRAADDRFTARRVFLNDGPRRLKGFPMVMRGFTPALPPVAPLLGEHSDSVLESLAASPAARP